MKPASACFAFLLLRVAAAALLLTTPALGQSGQSAASAQPDTSMTTQACDCMHTGFHFRVSSGLGYLAIRGDVPSQDVSLSTLGSSIGIVGGGTIVRGLALAGTLHAVHGTAKFHGGPFENAVIVSSLGNRLASANNDADVTLVEFGLLVDWFPNPRGGWHVGSMVGPGGVVITTLVNGADMSTLALTGSVFGGYDFCFARDLSAGLMFVASGATRAALKDSDDHDTGYRVQALAFALEGSFLFY